MKIYGLKKSKLKRVIKNRDVSISVFGLGKIGLPTACVFGDKGFKVIGVDINDKVVKKINRGISHISEPKVPTLVKKLVKTRRLTATTDGAWAVKNSDVSIIIVPITVKDGKPYLKHLLDVTRVIMKNFEENHLIIISSTLPPGTSLKVYKELKKTKRKFGLVHAPERVSPGTVIRDLTGQYPQIIGGIDEHSAMAAEALYKTINPRVLIAPNIATAEMVKLAEMVERDVRIAYANELALLCQKLGIDVGEVIKLANTNKPYTHILQPGVGVGGLCIPVYPYFLISKVPRVTRIIRTARKVNESMPKELSKLVLEGLKSVDLDAKKAKVGILGLAYKPGVKDDTFSPAYDLVKELKRKGVKNIYLFDPLFTKNEIEEKTSVAYESFEDLVKKSDCLVLVTAHKEFKKVYGMLKESKVKVFIDGRNFFEKGKIESKGVRYVSI